MTDAEERPNDLMRHLLDAGERAAQERHEDWDRVWSDLIEAEARLARLRDDPEVRSEVEARAAAWFDRVAGSAFTPERSRPEVIALADRMKSLVDEVAEIANEARALSVAAQGHGIGEEASEIFLGLLTAWDALTPASEAAEKLRRAPIKSGGPGEYTENLRSRASEEFGRAMVPLFRRVGLPLGGNAGKDKAFATFLDVMHEHIEGRPIPGKGKLLADLRKL